MLNSVIRSKVYGEFTPEDQKYWFSIKNKAVSHHIDTLYYSIFLSDDDVNCSNPGLIALLKVLHEKKLEKQDNLSAEVEFYGMSVHSFGAQVAGGMYMNHLSYGDDFDVFITDYIPNKDTPRIQVQLRTRSLVLDGLYGAINKSYLLIIQFLSYYGLNVSEIAENRIDYAFHTNIIQDPMKMFSDEKLAYHLFSNFREAWKHLWLTRRRAKMFDLDYFALGSRRSNNVYFRIYSKVKEVIQKNYKGFFFKRWLDEGIISRYDEYVYRRAYELKSFKTGCLVGRIEWYLDFGSDKELKVQLRKLLETCNIKSDNNPRIESAIKGILPEPTTVLNFEFETKRKFYLKCAHFISCYDYKHKGHEDLKRLYKVLSLRREFIDKLMTEVVSFVKDNTDPDSPELDFWHRIRCTKIEDQPDKPILRAWYSYSNNLDLQRSKNSLARNIAGLSIIKRNEASESTFSEDIWEALTLLNDNDMQDIDKKVFENLEPFNYKDIQKRKSRQMKGLIHSTELESFNEDIYIPEALSRGSQILDFIASLESVTPDELIFDDEIEVID